MIELVLERFLASTEGVFGVLTVRGFHFFTCEEEDLGNRVSVSSIPAGEYRLERTIYQKYGYPTFEVMDVFGRLDITGFRGGSDDAVVEGWWTLDMGAAGLDCPPRDRPGKPGRPRVYLISANLHLMVVVGVKDRQKCRK